MYKFIITTTDKCEFFIYFRYRIDAAEAAAAIIKSQFVSSCSIVDMSSEEIEKVFREVKGFVK